MVTGSGDDGDEIRLFNRSSHFFSTVFTSRVSEFEIVSSLVLRQGLSNINEVHSSVVRAMVL